MALVLYSDKLAHPYWQKKRLKILERDNWTCQLCGDTATTLHVHHKKYTSKNPWSAPDADLITYCEVCHGIVETYKEYKVLKVIKKPHKVRPQESYIYILAYNDKFKVTFITIVTYNHTDKAIDNNEKVNLLFEDDYEIISKLIKAMIYNFTLKYLVVIFCEHIFTP